MTLTSRQKAYNAHLLHHTPDNKALNCFLTNTQSVSNKLSELRALVAQNNYHVIGVTESWCNESISDGELCLKGYNLFRTDRKSGNGGGVLLYLHESLPLASLCNSLMSYDVDDSLWCSVTLRNSQQLLIGIVYRSPSSSDTNNSRLLSAIRGINELKQFSQVLLMGDFNVPGINWEDLDHTGSVSSFASDLLDATDDVYLFQHVTGFTRHRSGQRPSLLDLVFTFNSNSIQSIQHHSPLGSSDHDCLTWQYECLFNKTIVEGLSYKYWKGNYAAISEEFNETDWDLLFSNDDIEINWRLFKEKIISVADKYIPRVTKRTPSNKPPWWTSSLAKAIKQKQELYSTFKFTHLSSDYKAYTIKRNKVKSMTRAAQAKYDQKLIDKFHDNPKALYGYMRDKCGIKPKIGQVVKTDGTLTANDRETAEVLNNFFQSAFTSEHGAAKIPPLNAEQLCDISITRTEIFETLAALKPNKAPGPDNIHSQILKNCAGSLAKPLVSLFTQSINTGILPGDWRRANVTPVFKKGSKISPENYRPISLTSQVVKVLEGLVRSKMMSFLDENDIITNCQHGFIKKKSCFTNLLTTLEDWTSAVDQDYGVDVAYLDFSKAFDSVPHHRLLQKLASYGFSGQLLCWLEGFLSDRCQRVILNGSFSDWCPVTSGVPQGSVLGPLLFTLYINDIPNIVHTDLSFFADDSKVYTVIRTLEDSHRLQADLDSIQNWCQLWLLRLNLLKCKVMHVGYSHFVTEYVLSDNSGEHVKLTEVDNEKDLGVWISRDLKPSLHCTKAVASAMRVLAMIRRAFVNISKELFVFLYRTYVRPHLEYCVPIWNPSLAKDIDALEKVQKRATKMVRGLKNLSYEQRLKSLDLYTLFRRRQRGDLIEVYKLLNRYYDIDPTNFFVLCDNSNTRGHHMKLYKCHTRLNVQSTFFTQRVVNSWNNLPLEVVSAHSVSSFKSKLDDFWRCSGYGYEQRLIA